MLAAAPILCALLATYQVPTGTLGDGFAGPRVRGLDRILEVASGPDAQPTPESHWPSPLTNGETASGPSSQYNGRVYDPETGFHDYGARMYWPEIGRFISADSVVGKLALPATLNRYAYVLNNPCVFVDPSGNDPVRVSLSGCGDCHAGTLQADYLKDLAYRGHELEIVNASIALMWISAAAELTEFALAARSARTLRSLEETANISGILREAAKGKGNFGLGTATAEEAEAAGQAWVGPRARVASDGTTLVSEDGLRVYRPPSYKPKLKKVQANLEQKAAPGEKPVSNGHLDVPEKK